MAVGHTLAATIASRIYLSIIALVTLPMYLHMLGQEAYGLVTLFLVLQVWLQMLDFGAAATLARETARERAGVDAADGPRVRQLLATTERLFAMVTGVAALTVWALSGVVANHWLVTEQVSTAAAADSLRLMVLCVLMRLLGDLYRGVIAGSERLAWLALVNAFFGTLRLLGVVPFLLWAGPDPVHFFAFQLTVYLFEAVVVRAQAWQLLPSAVVSGRGFSMQSRRGLVGFSLSMALASAVWSMASQVDKLFLSGFLSLSEFGAFGLAIAAAGSVLIVASALADTLIPRFTALQARDARLELQAVYRTATQWVTIVAAGSAGWLACHAERIVWVWTGDAAMASASAPVLALYAIGNAAMSVAAYPFYLQLARGQLRLHLVGTGMMFIALLVGVLWAAPRHGALGAATVWLIVNVLYLLVWTPVAHGRFLPGLHGRWLRVDVLPVALLAAAAAMATRALPWPTDRVAAGLVLLLVGALILLAGAAGSGWVRSAAWRCSRFA